LIERSFEGLSVAVETVKIIKELVEIWPNEVCDSFGITGGGRARGNLATDNGGGWAEMVLSEAEGAEHNTDWKASFVRRAWSILLAALYHVSGSVSASHP